MSTDLTPPPDARDEELKRRRRRNNIALGLVLGALVVIFYALTIVKMGPGVFNREL